MKLEATFKKLKINPEKRTAKEDLKQPKQVEITLLVDYDDILDAEYGNIALAQANEDLVDVTLEVRQLLMEYPRTTTPVADDDG